MSFCKSHDKIRQMFAKDILYTYAYLEGTFALHNDKGKQSNFALKQIFFYPICNPTMSWVCC